MNSEHSTVENFENLKFDPISASNILLKQNLDPDENFYSIVFKP